MICRPKIKIIDGGTEEIERMVVHIIEIHVI